MTIVLAPERSATSTPSVWEGRSAGLLKLFGPVLVVTGVLGFITPPSLALMSGAAPYNLFHIAFGLVGTALAFKAPPRFASLFNATFGAIDLYQALASVAALPPSAQFAYKPADDLLHVVLGLALVAVGIAGFQRSAKA